MIFRFTLSHEILGTQEISEPIGWLDTKLTLERHADFGSLIEYFNGSFTFYGNNGEEDGGIDFIREVESTYGVDAYLGILIELAPDNYTFETVFTGQLDLSSINEMQDNKAELAIIRDDFWAKFINRYDTQVDIQSDEDLDGDPCNIVEHINLSLTPQIIRTKILSKFEDDGYGIQEYDDWGYIEYGAYFVPQPNFIQLDWPVHEMAEVEDEYSIPLSPNTQKPVSKIIANYGGNYTFDIVVDLLYRDSDLTPPFPFPSEKYDLKLEFGDGTIVSATTVDTVTDYLPSPGIYNKFSRYTINYSKDLIVAETVKVYFEKIPGDPFTFQFYYVFDGLVYPERITGYSPVNHFNVTANTIFPTTNANSFFTHDVAGSICDRTIGRNDSFYSELLGSDKTKYRQYEENGCRWTYVNVQGLQLRQYNLAEKPYSLSMKKWFDGINPITPLSLMYDEIEGEPVIRAEEREFVFDATTTSVDINFVRNILRRYDPDLLYKTVKTGFKKWESEEISGIDDPQTKHTYATQLKRTGKGLTMESEFIAASLAIENTRRTTRIRSADYKFDNDTFIIAINPEQQTISPDVSPDIDDYIPELDENFTSITGLLNAETRYNTRLTPGRSLLRWLRFLSISLAQYIGSPFKFTYGEGNYAMESTLVDSCEPNPEELAENQDITSVTPVHLPFEYELTDVPLDYEDYRLIAQNRTKAIGISQTDENHTKFFIKKLEYDIVQGLASITAWPKTFMDILVIEGEFPLKDCPTGTLPDGCYRITEDGDLRITESGDYRILEDC